NDATPAGLPPDRVPTRWIREIADKSAGLAKWLVPLTSYRPKDIDESKLFNVHRECAELEKRLHEINRAADRIRVPNLTGLEHIRDALSRIVRNHFAGAENRVIYTASSTTRRDRLEECDCWVVRPKAGYMVVPAATIDLLSRGAKLLREAAEPKRQTKEKPS